MDAYNEFQGYTVPRVVTGKPLSLGRSEGNAGAGGLDVAVCMSETSKLLNINVRGATVAIQGYGKVWRNTTKYQKRWNVK